MEGKERYWKITCHLTCARDVKTTSIIPAISELEVRNAMELEWRKMGVEGKIDTIQEIDTVSYLAYTIDQIDRKTQRLQTTQYIVCCLLIIIVISIIILILV